MIALDALTGGARVLEGETIDGNGMGHARGDSRTMVALAERVAVVETKIGALKEDTAVIRSTQHDTHNRMQEFVAAEQMCAQNLGRLIEAQTTTNAQLSKLAATVEGLTLVRAQVEGGWKATVRFSTLIAAVLSGFVAVVGGVMWAMGHLAVHVSP